MSDRRYLVVNADDFGMSPGVSRGIIDAHTNGIVTSTSLMVRTPAAVRAVEMSRDYPALSLGLHVDLCEWEYFDGEWRLVYEVVPLQDEAAVAGEIKRQYERFCELVGRKPTHIDSHQHVHREQPLRKHLVELANAAGVPLRHCTPGLHYESIYGQTAHGDPYPEGIDPFVLIDVLKGLHSGVSELACHPGDASDIDTKYRSERTVEQQILCDPSVRAVIDEEGITLCSFAEVREHLTLSVE